MQDSGGAETALVGMLITSAVAIFFSCSGATGFSEIEFDSESSDFVFETWYSRTSVLDCCSRSGPALRWTDEAGEGYVSSSFLGTELSTLTLLPERSVRKIL